MPHPDAHLPIGIFDSGVGGLTVADAIRRALPQESIVYLGDCARVPYGNKSPETIVRFSREICHFLISKKVKAIVVACNTASAYALEQLQTEVSLPVIGVIEPGVNTALEATINKRIGIIGTTGTIRSMAYQKSLLNRDSQLHVVAHPAPLLVPLIEEHWLEHEATRLILRDYLLPFQNELIDTLVLACTHYPILKPVFQALLGDRVQLVDSSVACAQHLKQYLENNDQLHPLNENGKIHVYLTDLPQHFDSMLNSFLSSKPTTVEKVNLSENNAFIL